MGEKTVFQNNLDENIEDIWSSWKQKMLTAARNTIPKKGRRKHKLWITQEIINLMENRTELKDTRGLEYKKLR